MKTSIFYPKLKFSLRTLTIFSLSFSVFLLSLFFAPFYYGGDQIRYLHIYNDLSGRHLFESLDIYYSDIGSKELIHYLIVWIASNLSLGKNFVMAIANSILAYLIMRLFLHWRVSIYVSVAVIFTNFYVLTLYFSAERLKFAFIFTILSLLYSYRRQTKLSFLFALTSVLAHSQQILIYASLVFSSFMLGLSALLKTGMLNLKLLLSLIIIIISALAVFYFNSDHILYKLDYYSNNFGLEKNSLTGLWKPLLFLLLTLQYTKERLRVIYIYILLLLSAVIIGPERVTMIAYLFFMFYALQYNRGLNVGVILTSFYFAVKSYYYILAILNSGQGY